MSTLRQQILILHLATPNLESRTVAWALYDGASSASDLPMQSGDSSQPTYPSVVAAMRAGWRVMQVPALPLYMPGHEHVSGHLPYEYVLERMVTVNE